MRLLDGRTLRCDILAYAIEIRPRVELAREAGLAIDRGILADEYLQTNHPDIYAAGDVAQIYDPLSKRSMIDSLWAERRSIAQYRVELKGRGRSLPWAAMRAADGLTARLRTHFREQRT